MSNRPTLTELGFRLPWYVIVQEQDNRVFCVKLETTQEGKSKKAYTNFIAAFPDKPAMEEVAKRFEGCDTTKMVVTPLQALRFLNAALQDGIEFLTFDADASLADLMNSAVSVPKLIREIEEYLETTPSKHVSVREVLGRHDPHALSCAGTAELFHWQFPLFVPVTAGRVFVVDIFSKSHVDSGVKQGCALPMFTDRDLLDRYMTSEKQIGEPDEITDYEELAASLGQAIHLGCDDIIFDIKRVERDTQVRWCTKARVFFEKVALRVPQFAAQLDAFLQNLDKTLDEQEGS